MPLSEPKANKKWVCRQWCWLRCARSKETGRFLKETSVRMRGSILCESLVLERLYWKLSACTLQPMRWSALQYTWLQLCQTAGKNRRISSRSFLSYSSFFNKYTGEVLSEVLRSQMAFSFHTSTCISRRLIESNIFFSPHRQMVSTRISSNRLLSCLFFRQ